MRELTLAEIDVLLKLGETKSTVSNERPTQTSLLHHVARRLESKELCTPLLCDHYRLAASL